MGSFVAGHHSPFFLAEMQVGFRCKLEVVSCLVLRCTYATHVVAPPIKTLNKGLLFYPQHMFDAFTSAKTMQAYTNSPAECNPIKGGFFALFDGGLQGDPPSVAHLLDIAIFARFIRFSQITGLSLANWGEIEG